MFNVFDKSGRVYKCKFLFNFSQDDKNYIVYLDNEEEILASFYEMEGDRVVIFPIYDDKDFDIIDREIARRSEANEI